MTWDETKKNAADPNNPASDEQLPAPEYNAMVTDQKLRGKWELDGDTAFMVVPAQLGTPEIFEFRDKDGNPFFRYNKTKDITYLKGRVSKLV